MFMNDPEPVELSTGPVIRKQPGDNPAPLQAPPTRETQGDPKTPRPGTPRDPGSDPAKQSNGPSADAGCSPASGKSGATGGDCAR